MKVKLTQLKKFFFLVLELLTNSKDSLVREFACYTEDSKVR